MPELIIDPRHAYIGPGLAVRRILPFRLRRMVGPFIFMDHAGPVDLSSSEKSKFDVLPHPHIGLSTVTYLFGGHVTHRDSLGVEQVIRPGEVNWMTAGKGIAHSERFEELINKGAVNPEKPDGVKSDLSSLEMIQTWVALPESREEADPSFRNYSVNDLPVFTDKGVWMRLVAGNAYGAQSKVQVESPLFYMYAVLTSGAMLELPAGASERAVYIAKGSLEVDQRVFTEGQLLVFRESDKPVVKATENATLMLLGGEPLGHRYIWWNFVSSRKERIEQAKDDWKNGRILLPPNDNKEFVPLPDDKSTPQPPPPNVLS